MTNLSISRFRERFVGDLVAYVSADAWTLEVYRVYLPGYVRYEGPTPHERCDIPLRSLEYDGAVLILPSFAGPVPLEAPRDG
jgi:hypothetical protein